jgi:hypothetical protein
VPTSVIKSLTRRGVPELLVILPDGSRTLIPVAWTVWNGRQDAGLVSPAGDDADATENLCTISDLLKARAVTDALLSRLVESAPGQEGDDAVRVGVSQTADEPGRRIKRSQIDPQAQIAALVLLSRLIAQKLVANSAPESGDE